MPFHRHAVCGCFCTGARTGWLQQKPYGPREENVYYLGFTRGFANPCCSSQKGSAPPNPRWRHPVLCTAECHMARKSTPTRASPEPRQPRLPRGKARPGRDARSTHTDMYLGGYKGQHLLPRPQAGSPVANTRALGRWASAHLYQQPFSDLLRPWCQTPVLCVIRLEGRLHL